MQIIAILGNVDLLVEIPDFSSPRTPLIWFPSHAYKHPILIVTSYCSPIGITKMKKYFIPGYPEQIRVMLKWFLGSHKLSETPANLGGGLIYCGPMADGLIRRKPFR